MIGVCLFLVMFLIETLLRYHALLQFTVYAHLNRFTQFGVGGLYERHAHAFAC